MKYNVHPKELYNVYFKSGKHDLIQNNNLEKVYTLLYVQNGNVKIILNNDYLFLTSGQFIIVDSLFDINAFSNSTEEYSIIVASFSLDEKLDNNLLKIIINSNSRISPYISSIIYEQEHKQDNYQQLILYNIAAILLFIMRDGSNKFLSSINTINNNFTKELGTVNNQKIMIENCISIINQNINNQDLNVNFLTKRLFVSPAYLHKLFNKYMNTSINKYIQNLRLTRASQLLINSFIPVTEISEMLGFCSQCYFSSQFKKKTNMTPSEFRLSSINY